MGIEIEPEKFAELVVTANPSVKENAEDIAKDSLELYITAFKLAEKYGNCSINARETSDVLKEALELELNLTS
ncbi:hypothetical protein [Mammaliicoccus stepanovicii]|uniref:Uncharacterized protein n=1 Tax=Mammaliicoccus stepanovicii TaxID=643214 RepID=A0A239ZG53_9STAP|nr:hypothetical protein [Mammaliicoccus stepanovicii]PNZ79022.1 hypothetical protein CD111_01400 [Mammaliicoccus stepanovicii]GGI41878.1 hypothetical protein GCM10010896_15620 [Mammaliicoccus stepanovicii]SNV70049.1 Uncharacterised protein [Mammaliicoccus stepanovicii]